MKQAVMEDKRGCLYTYPGIRIPFWLLSQTSLKECAGVSGVDTGRTPDRIIVSGHLNGADLSQQTPSIKASSTRVDTGHWTLAGQWSPHNARSYLPVCSYSNSSP